MNMTAARTVLTNYGIGLGVAAGGNEVGVAVIVNTMQKATAL
jgi:hypothetical protein